MANYGGYGQSNPYAQQDAGNRYDAPAAGNPYAQQGGSQPVNGGRQQYGGGGANGTYDGGNEMEMGTVNGQGAHGQPASRDPNAILNECRDIDRGIDSIEQNLQRLRYLQQRAIDDPDASQNTQTNRELDAITAETMTLYRNFTQRLQSIKSQKASGEPRNAPQVGKVDRKLKSAINQYQQAERDFRRSLSAQMERQYRIVRPDASDQEVREAVEDTSNNQVFSQALLQGNRRGQAQSALRAVQGRHEAIQKIERQMEELAQLFAQVDEYVVQQEEQVEQIDMQGETIKQDIGNANTQLDTGIKSARSARRKKWWCLLIGIIIVAIIVIIVVIVVKVVLPKNNNGK